MTPRTLTAPPTDRGYWRRLLRLAHPDASGSHDLFVWVSALRDHVAGDALEDDRSSYQRHQPPPHPQTGERLDFTAAFEHASFADLTARAVGLADTVGEPYAALLHRLGDCYPAGETDAPLFRAQNVGASYKALAFAAHLAGMDAAQRSGWYRIAESIPMAQRHVGHIIAGVQAARGAA